jgi:antitoxin component HigA of HigAB toxin-antitoxin module
MLKNFFNKIKIVYLSIQNKLPILLGRIFTKPNLNKIIIIFIIGFISRIFINIIYNVNIFSNFLYQILGVYYLFLSSFIVLINEFIDYSHLTIDVNHFSNSSFKYKGYIFYTMNSVGEGSNSDNNGEESSSANFNDFKHPKHKRIRELIDSEKEYDSTQNLALQEQEKTINKYKKEFKEFYTINRDSIKLTRNDLEKLTIKVANKYYSIGSVSAVMEILPADIKPLYNKFMLNQLLGKVRFSSTR